MPTSKTKAAAAAKDAAYQRAKLVKKLLSARYPLIFGWGRPLAIGIDQQLRAVLSEAELSTEDMKLFFKFWVHRPAYLAALQRGERRVNLDGSDAGPGYDAERGQRQ